MAMISWKNDVTANLSFGGPISILVLVRFPIMSSSFCTWGVMTMAAPDNSVNWPNFVGTFDLFKLKNCFEIAFHGILGSRQHGRITNDILTIEKLRLEAALRRSMLLMSNEGYGREFESDSRHSLHFCWSQVMSVNFN